MAILGAMILGLTCGFYVYVAIRWWLEVMLIRREAGRVSSATVFLSAKLPDCRTISEPRDTQTSSINAGMGQAVSGWWQR
jgi:hypothetical protein